MKQPLKDLKRLASYVISARIEAGYPTRKHLAAAAGVTARTLGKLETGSEAVSADTLMRVARTIGWTPDSPALVMAGLEPRLAAAPAPVPSEDDGDDAVAAKIARHPPLARDTLEKLWGLELPRRDRLHLMRRWLEDNPGAERDQAAG